MDGYYLAAGVCFAAALLLAGVPLLIVVFGARDPAVGPRPESPSERNHRLDAEARDASDCEACGERCDVCDERMCSEDGPEPVITCDAHRCCVDCDDVALTCTACAAARALAMIEELA